MEWNLPAVTSSIRSNMASVMVSMRRVVAVLLIHMERNQVGTIMPISSLSDNSMFH